MAHRHQGRLQAQRANDLSVALGRREATRGALVDNGGDPDEHAASARGEPEGLLVLLVEQVLPPLAVRSRPNRPPAAGSTVTTLLRSNGGVGRQLHPLVRLRELAEADVVAWAAPRDCRA